MSMFRGIWLLEMLQLSLSSSSTTQILLVKWIRGLPTSLAVTYAPLQGNDSRSDDGGILFIFYFVGETSRVGLYTNQ